MIRRQMPTIAAAGSASGSVVDVLTGESTLVPPVAAGPMTATEARALTTRIRQAARDIHDRLERLRQLVDQAREHDVWSVLGYPSWGAYLVDTLEPMRLPRDDRREVVGYLTGQGLSTRAIAPIVSADPTTVSADRKAIAAAAAVLGPADATAGNPTPAVVHGLDGRDYALPAARPALVVVPSSSSSDASIPVPPAKDAAAFVELLADALRAHGSIDRADWDAALATASLTTAAPIAL